MSYPMHIPDDPELDQMVEKWFQWDRDETTKAEIQKLLKAGDTAELRKRLANRMNFGTAGLRARMGAGFAMMNDLTIIQTTQGLLRYLHEKFSNLTETGVVIGFDGRYNSERFSWLVTNIFVKASVLVYRFSKMNPTPYVPYTIRRMGCVCGIMITASHNPRFDNGYKVYWANGAQILSPHDVGISNSILNNLSPWWNSWDMTGLELNKLIHDPFPIICKAYNLDLRNLVTYPDLLDSSDLKFVYTPMHGVGHSFVEQAMKSFGLSKPIPVIEQKEPNPDFPTVKYPNPEEGQGALALAIETAENSKSPIILSNDPDVDRFAVAEKQNDGQWKIFTGNETGALFGWWLWHRYRKLHPDSKGSNVYMLASTVSSKILRSMAEKEGFKFMDTLTGFKWMGNKAYELLQSGYEVLLAYEEAIGFMIGTQVLDKDGISALCCMAEMACFLYSEGMTLSEQLSDIYKRYGLHLSLNSYYICQKPDIIKIIFESMRHRDTVNKYPTCCGAYEIERVSDITVGYDSGTLDEKTVLPADPTGQMITFTFSNDCVVTLRTSGTEPKIKYYSEIIIADENDLSREAAEHLLSDIVKAAVDDLLQPETFSLVHQSQ